MFLGVDSVTVWLWTTILLNSKAHTALYAFCTSFVSICCLMLFHSVICCCFGVVRCFRRNCTACLSLAVLLCFLLFFILFFNGCRVLSKLQINRFIVLWQFWEQYLILYASSASRNAKEKNQCCFGCRRSLIGSWSGSIGRCLLCFQLDAFVTALFGNLVTNHLSDVGLSRSTFQLVLRFWLRFNRDDL